MVLAFALAVRAPRDEARDSRPADGCAFAANDAPLHALRTLAGAAHSARAARRRPLALR